MKTPVGVVVKSPFEKPVLEVEDSVKLSQREKEMAQEVEKVKRRLNELEGPVGKPRPEFGKSYRSRGDIKFQVWETRTHCLRMPRGT